MIHKGVYGVFIDKNRLLVVHKTRGPYINRYDLPGGSIEEGETLLDALYRELQEEIGMTFKIEGFLCERDYLIKWSEGQLAHRASYYAVIPDGPLIHQIQADDTSGYDLIALDHLTEKNASPLVLDVLKNFAGQRTYHHWKVLIKNI